MISDTWRVLKDPTGLTATEAKLKKITPVPTSKEIKDQAFGSGGGGETDTIKQQMNQYLQDRLNVAP